MNISLNCTDSEFKLFLFLTYIRPILEYVTPIWSPYLINEIDRVESVQRRFTKFLTGYYDLSYVERLNRLKIKSLEERRINFDLILVYKIVNNLCFINFSDYFSFTNCRYNLRRNSLQIQHNCSFKIKLQSGLWHNSYFVRVVKVWNSLPDQVVTARSLSAFKARINEADLSCHLTITN